MSEEFFYDIPESVREALRRWAEQGQWPGGFVRSVLENDLAGAATRADWINGPRLVSIVQYCNMELPSNCWGSPEKVEAWAKRFAATEGEKA